MKKIMILAFAAAALSACGAPGGKTDAAATEPEKTTAQTAEATRSERGMAGAYTDQRPLRDEEPELFKTVTAGLVGVKYTPESVASQVVAGMNYRFVCTAETIAKDPRTFKAEIIVFQPLPGRGEAYITEIKRL